MDKEFSLKELYDVVIRTTQPLDIGDYHFEKDEAVAMFDKIQLANFNEVRKIVTANGGFGNEPRVWWETVKDVQLRFSQGVFNKIQLGILTNAKILQTSSTPIYFPKREILSLDENNNVETKKVAYSPIYVYDIETGQKLEYEIVEHTSTKSILNINNYTKTQVVVDYYEQYGENYSTMVVGQQLSNTYFTFFGKTRVKDDVDGKTRTAAIYIPQLKLMSDLSMRLGQQATPVVGDMYALACPIGEKGNKRVMELIYLSDDIDADV